MDGRARPTNIPLWISFPLSRCRGSPRVEPSVAVLAETAPSSVSLRVLDKIEASMLWSPISSVHAQPRLERQLFGVGWLVVSSKLPSVRLELA